MLNFTKINHLKPGEDNLNLIIKVLNIKQIIGMDKETQK